MKVWSALVVACVLLGANRCPAEPLLLIGQPPTEARFVGTTQAGKLRFQGEVQPREVEVTDLVRWSNAIPNSHRGEIVLRDGSRLALAKPWAGQPTWVLTKDSLVATTQLFGKVTVPRPQLHAILLNLSTDPRRRAKFYDQALASEQANDRLLLASGDQLTGKIANGNPAAPKSKVSFLLEGANQPMQVESKRLAAMVFAHPNLEQQPNIKQQSAQLLIRLRDGSLVRATSLVAEETQLKIQLASGIELTGTDYRDVDYLRSLTSPCRYLSDLRSVDYRHVPYLTVVWPFQNDRNVLGGPLQVGGHQYEKGVGMISAARLTYPLGSTKLPQRFTHFAAAVAIDDAASSGGSVIFRVYLFSRDEWQQAYESPIIRGGEQPVPVRVLLGDATQLMLVTDYADRGDERDYANWLDARLE